MSGNTLAHGALRELAVALHGNGRVARAFLAAAARRGFAIASVHDSKGERFRDATAPGRRVFVDCTAPAYAGGTAERWVARLEAELLSGTPVVTCNKAPLARAWTRLDHAARRGQTSLLASATVGAGTPVIEGLAAVRDAHGVAVVEASLSGTLSRLVAEIARGVALDEAVRAAQRDGLAEPDPRLDLDGTDAYAKAVILHNVAFRDAPRRSLDAPLGAHPLDARKIQAAVAAGLVPEVVARIEPSNITLRLEASPPERALRPPPGHVAVRATSVDGAHYTWHGPGAGPEVTANALVRDLARIAARGVAGAGLGV